MMPEPVAHPVQPPERGAAVTTHRWVSGAALASALVVAAGTVVLGVVAGLGWAAVAPRALLVMTAPGQAALVHAETSAFIAADGDFCVIGLAGGAVAGLAGYWFAVRRHGPLPMAGLAAGAAGAAFAARWIGERSGRARFHHLLATLPTGARFHDALALGAGSAIAFWPLAACLVAGALEMYLTPRLPGS